MMLAVLDCGRPSGPTKLQIWRGFGPAKRQRMLCAWVTWTVVIPTDAHDARLVGCGRQSGMRIVLAVQVVAG